MINRHHLEPPPLTVSEEIFKRRVIGLAKVCHWRVCHFRPARTKHGWATPIEGDTGFPDLVLARAGRVLLPELKRETGRAAPAQRLWLAALGGYGRLWRPSDWPEIVAELTAPPDARHPSTQALRRNP